MDIADVRLIQALIDGGSLSEASIRLNQSQPTLSRKLARLEDRLGTRLFHRSPRGLVATDIARYITVRAGPLEDRLRQIERQVDLVIRLETGSLRLGVGPIIEQLLLPDVISGFIETTGATALSVVTDNDKTLLDQFEAAALDLVVGPFRPDDWPEGDVQARPMIRDDIVAVARAGHPIFANAPIDGALLADFPWAAPKMQGSARQIAGGPPLQRPKIVCDNYGLLKRLTLRHDLLCMAPRSVFRQELTRGRMREVPVDLQITWESALLIRTETLLAPLASHLVSLFEAASEAVTAPGR